MRARRWLMTPAIAALGLLVMAAPALAQVPGGSGSDAFVVLTGDLFVPEDASYTDALIFNGNAVIEGTVTDSVVAFNGDVTVRGTVGGDVAALNGQVIVKSGADVGGNISSSNLPDVAPDASVGGTIGTANTEVNLDALRFATRIAWWIGTTVSTFVLGLLLTLAVPGAADAVATAARRRVGPSAGWGALGIIVLPIVAFVTVFTVVGALLGVGVLLALMLIYSVGYAAGGLALGRLILKPPTHRFLAFLLGWGVLRLVGLVPFLGGLLFFIAAGWGLGALIVAGYRSSRNPRPETSSLPPLPPMPVGP